MADERTDEEKISEILLKDDRYKREAYRFVQEALEFTRRRHRRKGHVTGKELALGVRDLARERFGLMAKTVLNQWGVEKTDDIGDLVFNMVEEQIMIKEDEDAQQHFENIYDFEEAFETDFRIELEGKG